MARSTLKSLVLRTPFAPAARLASAVIGRYSFKSSGSYWEQRYKKGGTSGAGSSGSESLSPAASSHPLTHSSASESESAKAMVLNFMGSPESNNYRDSDPYKDSEAASASH